MVSSGHVSKIYAGKTKQSEVRIYLPGTAALARAKVVSIFFGLTWACTWLVRWDFTAFKLSRDQRSFEVSSRHFARAEAGFRSGRAQAPQPARLNSFLPLQLYLQPFC
jgi:hypothetical protein